MDVLKDLENIEDIEVSTHLDDFVESETACCLCGTPLLFQHEVDPMDLAVNEKAFCPSCKIQTKERKHPLH